MKDRMQLVKGDITQLQVDAIVNAANTALESGGGVCGAIFEAAGAALPGACASLGGCSVGHAKLTPAYELPAHYIIHAVGPVWRGGAKGEPKLLASCYVASLKLALEHQIKTIAFPAISCGIYGYPVSQAVTIAVNETANFLELHPEIKMVLFVCQDEAVYEAYQQALDSLNHE
ncbi:MAG: O-acetyl-ADP-ribose deacetylase [Gammaproteobacteria bacterium RIFCSPHIGHO2_12_FULL_45_12]|nr:MAG: O-acetyl-ADP-ribose deacetylase [Gammaproteobacteria bacterium RIFCSPHIGHO2_12_FULL_45_12]